jgi:hypothetical protein
VWELIEVEDCFRADTQEADNESEPCTANIIGICVTL